MPRSGPVDALPRGAAEVLPAAILRAEMRKLLDSK